MKELHKNYVLIEFKLDCGSVCINRYGELIIAGTRATQAPLKNILRQLGPCARLDSVRTSLDGRTVERIKINDTIIRRFSYLDLHGQATSETEWDVPNEKTGKEKGGK